MNITSCFLLRLSCYSLGRLTKFGHYWAARYHDITGISRLDVIEQHGTNDT